MTHGFVAEKKLLSNNKLLELLVGLVEIIVNNDKIMGSRLLGVGELSLGSSQTLLQRLVGLRSSAGESRSQLLDGRRSDKKVSGLEIGLLDGLDSLHINVENALLVVVGHLLDSGDGGAVVVASELGPFDEGSILNQLFELVHSHKVVVLAVDFSVSGLSGGVGNGEAEPVGVFGQQSLEKSGLAGSTGARDDDGCEIAHFVLDGRGVLCVS
jgi:hypothetical protein